MRPRRGASKWLQVSVVPLVICAQWLSKVSSQTITPPQISTCESGPNSVTFSVPVTTTQDVVDIMFVFDDTGTFIAASSTVARAFASIVSGLIEAYPSVNFGYGVGRFEDFGG